MDTNHSFEYTTLPVDTHHIRLLHFEETHPGRPLKFSLHAQTHSNDLKYNAISYQWGDAVADQAVSINGATFLVRENLHDFLEILSRTEFRSTPLFIDAICINQSDIPERSTQVQNMHLVYSKAVHVLVWLGPATTESDTIFDLCAKHANDRIPGNPHTSVKLDDVISETIESGDKEPYDDKLASIDLNSSDGDALDSIYQRSYWTRVWILQELHLAQRLVFFCGEKKVPWEVFRRLPKHTVGHVAGPRFMGGFFLKENSTPGGRLARKVLAELDVRWRSRNEGYVREPQTLFEVIQVLGRAQCMDVRDRVYGLLSFAAREAEVEEAGTDSKRRAQELVVDYSVSPAILFTQVLATEKYRLFLGSAVATFDALELQHHLEQFDEEFLARIPERRSEREFQIVFDHLGKLAPRGSIWYEKNVEQIQRRAIYPSAILLSRLGLSAFEFADMPVTMANFNQGPILSLGPYRHCVMGNWELGTDTSDLQAFTLDGTRLMLIVAPYRHKSEISDELGDVLDGVHEGSLIPGQWGVMANRTDEKSLIEAAKILEYVEHYLPTIPKQGLLQLRNDEIRYCMLDFLKVAVTLNQVVRIVAKAGAHGNYYDSLDA